MRYMIERGLYLAHLLNRTLILPTHLRIRQCSNITVCIQTATPLDLEAIGRNEQESTLALDLGYFFNLPHLAQMTGNRVLDFRTFMEDVVGVPKNSRLVDSQFGAQVAFWQNIIHQQKNSAVADQVSMELFIATDDDNEDDDEYIVFDRENKVEAELVDQSGGTLSIERLRRAKWDLEERDDLSFIDNLIRNAVVDDLPEPRQDEREGIESNGDGAFRIKRSFYAFGDVRGGGLDRIVEWSVDWKYEQDHVRDEQHKGKPLLESCHVPVEDSSVEQLPWEARFPSFATCRIENYVGLKQELDPVQARILSIEGQFHTTGWIPIVYSSLENAQEYRSMAMSHLRYAPSVEEAADILMGKLKAVNNIKRITDQDPGGNQSNSSWLPLSMHVRRGDFVVDGHGWQEFDDGWMRSVVKDMVEEVFPLQSRPDQQTTSTVGFYMATDETSPEVLDYFRSLGAILFEDLIDQSFEERFGHLIVYDDWVGLVEQHICARARMFYGTMSSSFTSGITNMRLALRDTHNLNSDEASVEKYDSAYLLKKGGPVITREQQAFGETLQQKLG
ncbi:hypothetical protein BGZ51_003097 [Haplosporangium sp. Z 767]|nr:hypothetical protein BGZ51_003097 [Haplosporangium sp. Z 767]KAF9195718.1 hypothetical protein BGZ50_003665 [Haplosporangium sp. Z 11]